MNREDVVAKAAWDNGCTTIAEELAFRKGSQYCEDNPAWRMCEDELPYPNEDVLVVPFYGPILIGHYSKKSGWKLHTSYPQVYGEVVAWLPLPQFDNPKAKK